MPRKWRITTVYFAGEEDKMQGRVVFLKPLNGPQAEQWRDHAIPDT